MVGSRDAWGHHPRGAGSWDLGSDEWGLQWGEWRLQPERPRRSSANHCRPEHRTGRVPNGLLTTST